MTPRRRAAPTLDERAVVDVYRRAEHYLLTAAATEAGKTVRNADHTARGVQAVRQATAAVVRQLDVVTPGLLAERLRASTEDGARDAARLLAEIPGRELDRTRNVDPGVNLGALDRLAVATAERTTEVHRAILRNVPDAYRRAIERALPAGLVGAETRRQVTQRAMWELADQGITAFVDRSGRTWRASTYVEMATRAALQRATEDAKLDHLAAAGHDLVIVNGGRDRCPRCLPWNGRVLSIARRTPLGVSQVVDTIDGTTLVDVDVRGTVEQARAAGWGHPNCRCGLDLWQPGITRPVPAAQRKPDGQYEARQRQRAIERDIRRHKEREAAAIDKAGTTEARKLVRAAQARMREHLEANPDLLRRSYREQIGTGNVPTADDVARFAAEDAAGLPDAPRPTTVSRLRRGEVRDRAQAARDRGDTEAADVYTAEDERRDARQARRRRTA